MWLDDHLLDKCEKSAIFWRNYCLLSPIRRQEHDRCPICRRPAVTPAEACTWLVSSVSPPRGGEIWTKNADQWDGSDSGRRWTEGSLIWTPTLNNGRRIDGLKLSFFPFLIIFNQRAYDSPKCCVLVITRYTASVSHIVCFYGKPLCNGTNRYSTDFFNFAVQTYIAERYAHPLPLSARALHMRKKTDQGVMPL
jgi:hypothetical protein